MTFDDALNICKEDGALFIGSRTTYNKILPFLNENNLVNEGKLRFIWFTNFNLKDVASKLEVK